MRGKGVLANSSYPNRPCTRLRHGLFSVGMVKAIVRSAMIPRYSISIPVHSEKQLFYVRLRGDMNSFHSIGICAIRCEEKGGTCRTRVGENPSPKPPRPKRVRSTPVLLKTLQDHQPFTLPPAYQAKLLETEIAIAQGEKCLLESNIYSSKYVEVPYKSTPKNEYWASQVSKKMAVQHS